MPPLPALAGYGEAKRDGGDAFAAMANAKGGIAGKRSVISTEDDAYDERAHRGKHIEPRVGALARRIRWIRRYAGVFGCGCRVGQTWHSRLLMALLTPSAIALAKELRYQRSQQQLWCLSAVDSTLLQQNLGAAARGVATSVIAPPVTRRSVPLVREYIAATAAIGKPSTAYGLEAFVEMKALAQGLARARSASAQDVCDHG